MRTRHLLLVVCWCGALWGLEEEEEEAPVVETRRGLLRGSTMISWTGSTFFAFRGVRYARPPLRFKGPVAVEPWEGIADATQDPPACPQILDGVYPSEEHLNTSEDCLFLNIYTKKLNEKYPVIVFFHPGNFMWGSARSDFMGPQYLLERDIVLVMPQSRLGPLGFLRTGDDDSVDNCGLRDQTMALTWIHNNIRYFGGDPSRITIAGYGSGSTSVLLHLLSFASFGLFHRAIAMSGPFLGEEMVRDDVQMLTEGLANATNCSAESPHLVVECLRSLPVESIVGDHLFQISNNEETMISFGPFVERSSQQGRHKPRISQPPLAYLNQGRFIHVPLLIGHTKDEFLTKYPLLIEESDEEYDRLTEMKDQTELLRILYYTYLGNETLRNETYGTTKFLSDKIYIYPIQKGAKLFTLINTEPVYFYTTTMTGPADVSGYTRNGRNEAACPSVCHEDDLQFLFYFPQLGPLAKPTDPVASDIRTFTSVWYNFASKGDPTPESAPQNVKWLPMSGVPFSHFEIGPELGMKSGLPHEERMRVFADYETVLTSARSYSRYGSRF